MPDPGASADVGQAPRRLSLRLLRPLRIRDFALLWSGQTVSLLGDGVYFVAIAWQVYELSNRPSALAAVGVAWTLPFVASVLFGGVASDRFDRRRLLVAADLFRFFALAGIATLAVTDSLELWHLYGLVAVYGLGEALFWPAFGAIVPDIVPPELLVEANSLDQFVRPLAVQLVGPAVGGALVAAWGTGVAFSVDAASFALSALAILLISPRALAGEPEERRSMLSEIREGVRFIRSQTWLWGSIVCGAVTYLIFWGPYEVLVPYITKNDLGGGAGDVGLVFAAGGLGAVVAALVMGQAGTLTRRPITFMYLTWAVAYFALVGFELAGAVWHAALANVIFGATASASTIVWITLRHRHVSAELLGRVTSLDGLVALGLVPASFALTAPIADALGAGPTLLGAGIVGGSVVLLFLFLPGMRDLDRQPPREADGPPTPPG